MELPPPEKIREMYQIDGLTAREIADRCGCSAETMRRYMVRSDIPLRRGGGRCGKMSKNWKGGIHVDQRGYVFRYASDHPNANGCYVQEHRLVMEQHLGRILRKDEVVHHKDGNPGNNSLDNLQLFRNNGHHLKKSLAGKCPAWTPQGKAGILASLELRKVKFPPIATMTKWYLEDQLTTAAIALKVGCEATAVVNYLHRNNISLRKGGKLEPKIQWPPRQDVHSLYQRMTLAELAAYYNVGPASLLRCLADYNIPTRPRGGPLQRRLPPLRKPTDPLPPKSGALPRL